MAPERCYQENPAGLSVELRVQPRASADRVEGEVDGRLRVRLAAPPVDDAANRAVVEVVAAWLGVPRSRVRLVAGHKSREKRVQVDGEPAALAAAIAARLH